MRCSSWKLLGLLGITADDRRAGRRRGPDRPRGAVDRTYRLGGRRYGAGAELAVADLNAKGGVLGEQIELITVDDYCDGEQAVAAANKLVADGVVAVVRPPVLGRRDPRVEDLYEAAGVLMISTFATNPKLTEQGFANVFRVVGRDDLQGRIAGDLLAERWGDKPIAILHDGQAYGKGLAEETKKRLNERGIAEAMFEAIEPGKATTGTSSRRCGRWASRFCTSAAISRRRR